MQLNNKASFKAITKADTKAFKKELRQTIRCLKNENLSKAELTASIEGVNSVQDEAF